MSTVIKKKKKKRAKGELKVIFVLFLMRERRKGKPARDNLKDENQKGQKESNEAKGFQEEGVRRTG